MPAFERTLNQQLIVSYRIVWYEGWLQCRRTYVNRECRCRQTALRVIVRHAWLSSSVAMQTRSTTSALNRDHILIFTLSRRSPHVASTMKPMLRRTTRKYQPTSWTKPPRWDAANQRIGAIVSPSDRGPIFGAGRTLACQPASTRRVKAYRVGQKSEATNSWP